MKTYHVSFSFSVPDDIPPSEVIKVTAEQLTSASEFPLNDLEVKAIE